MLLSVRIPEKLANILIFCYLAPIRIRPPLIINMGLNAFVVCKAASRACTVSLSPHNNLGSLQSNFTEVITLDS